MLRYNISNIIIRISFSSSYFSTFQYIVQVLTTYTHTVICWYSSLLLLFFSLWASWFQKLIQIVTNTNWTSELKILHTWGSKHQNNGSSHSRQKHMIYYSLLQSPLTITLCTYSIDLLLQGVVRPCRLVYLQYQHEWITFAAL